MGWQMAAPKANQAPTKRYKSFAEDNIHTIIKFTNPVYTNEHQRTFERGYVVGLDFGYLLYYKCFLEMEKIKP